MSQTKHKHKPFMKGNIMSPKIKKNDLSSKAMLVHLKISSWSGRKLDKKQTSKVLTLENTASDAGNWWTRLVPKSKIKGVEAAAFQVRWHHHQMTLPWMDGGLRILSSELFMDYTSKIGKLIDTYNNEVTAFVKDWDDIVADAPSRLKGLLNGYIFPGKEEIKSKFHIAVDYSPMPKAEDFRCDLSSDELDDIKKNFTDAFNDRMGAAVSSVWEKLAELVDKVQVTLNEPKKVFRDSLINNLKEYVELIPKINFTDDKDLEVIRKEVLAKLSKLNVGDLRAEPVTRKKAAKEAKEVLKKMKGYGC